MAKIPGPETLPGQPPPAADQPVSTDRWMSELGSLLQELENVTAANRTLPPVLGETADNQLVQVRLGIASSLFAALRCKHAATAGHALRVALTCSGWALRMGLKQPQRDVVEIAALLHDVGVIGVPDHILLKPGLLDSDEAAIVTRSRHMSLEILRQSCTSPEILEIVEHVPAWYDGTREGFRLCGPAIPLGGRMIAIAEAFDAMTTDHVYRPAMSHERALAELFECAGSQFDPDLVEKYAEFHGGNPSELHREVAGRWLHSLDPELVDSYWQLNCVPSLPESPGIAPFFQTKLLDNMYDAVVFIDAGLQVTLWNRGTERLTGIAESGVRGRQWHPDLLNMSDEKGLRVSQTDCPVNCAIRSGVQSLRRLTICGRSGQPVSVDSHAMPVTAEDGTTLGAILLFHDASSETSLEQRCQSLHVKATLDPLTQLANRAEFDRVHEMFVDAHQQRQVPCSLIILDLDRFKNVNDTYGHQAGDEVLIALATLMKSSCRPGDLVARYGGEEFVVLCADCDSAAVTRRAEQIRKAFSQMPQSKMDGRPLTASFGVTEIQPGDTPETMLRRADRALLMAKAKGRNTVVQLGAGSGDEQTNAKKEFRVRKKARSKELIERVLVTPVPVKMAIEKLRGFVADHRAKIVKTDGNHVRLEIDDEQRGLLRRLADRPVTFCLDLHFEEERISRGKDGQPSGGVLRTKIQLDIGPKKNRDRRRHNVTGRAREVLASFRSYLMAVEEAASPQEGALTRAKRILAPWLTRK